MFVQPAISLIFLSLFAPAALSRAVDPLVVQPDGPWTHDDPTKVPVTLGVMSGCPDAILCESVFDRVIERVADKMELRLTFIGT